jgi:hypothetical protein
MEPYMLTLTTPAPQIAVLDRGFVYVGLCAVADGMLTITKAQNVRRWGTSAGLGQLAQSGPTGSTKLDAAGTVRAPLSSVMHLIDCAPAAWPAFAV